MSKRIKASIRIGFIGFGEVASTLSAQLVTKGASVAAYDLLLSEANATDALRARARSCGVELCDLSELLGCCDYVFSAVTTQVAKQVAIDAAAHLRKGQLYLDLNSTSAAVKIELARIITATGGDFVEGAILGAVGAAGAAAPILTGGARAAEVADRFSKLGLNVSFYSEEIGKASLFKMLRSIFSKGMEALLLELLTAGKLAGIEEDLWTDVAAFMRDHSFETVSSNWVISHATAHQRRHEEMLQVVETVRGLGLDPLMARATEEFFERSCSLDWRQAFSEKPKSMQAVSSFLANQIGDQPQPTKN